MNCYGVINCHSDFPPFTLFLTIYFVFGFRSFIHQVKGGKERNIPEEQSCLKVSRKDLVNVWENVSLVAKNRLLHSR